MAMEQRDTGREGGRRKENVSDASEAEQKQVNPPSDTDDLHAETFAADAERNKGER